MGFVKGVFCKINHFIVNFAGDLFINAVVDTARHIFIRIAVNKIFPLFFHNGSFLF